ncbi:hypothetical protein JLBYU08_132 [Escherichia phage JLBYU08]|nr:hypothetical protein JLBYU08_132 [Escherichia phage JLBYU08]
MTELLKIAQSVQFMKQSFVRTPLVKALLEEGAPLSQEEIDELENSAQCLTFKDDEGDSVWCTVNEVVFVKPEH